METREVEPQKLLLGDDRAEPVSGDYLPVIDPATGKAFSEIPRGGPEDVDRAVSIAAEAQRGWARVTPLERGRALARVAEAITRHRDELAERECREVGKPLAQAYADADIAARYFEFYGGLVDKVRGTTIPLGEGTVDYTVHEPLGVSAQIVPWNYPLQIGARGMAAPLAAGNAVVVKPAEDGSLSLLRIASIALGEGIPPGVINVVTGLGAEAGAALAGHPGIDQVTFTGSARTGVEVARAAAANVVPAVLELGGKCPAVLLDDADLDRAIPTIVKASTQNAGQTCSAISRVVVDGRLHDETIERLASAFEEIEVGPGIDDPGMGPLISARQREIVQSIVGDAIDQGGAVVTGGSVPDDRQDQGFFFEPTLIDGVTPDMRLAREEAFGPVLAVIEVNGEEEAVAVANGTEFGLVSGVWTNDVSRAHRVAARLQSGQVFVNSYGAAGGIELPFGGYKQSGFGREKGIEGLASYQQVKNICVGL